MPPTANKSKVTLKNYNEFGTRIVTNSNTVFFYQPPNGEPITDEDYGVFSAGMLHNDQEHEIRAFSSNLKSQIAEAVIIYNCSEKYAKNEAAVNKGTPVSIFLRKAAGLDANGDARPKIYFSQIGRDMSITVGVAALESFEKLSPGDAFRYGVDKDGNADKIDILYKFDQNRLLREGGNGVTYGNGRAPADWLASGATRVTFGAVYGGENATMAYINQSEYGGAYLESPLGVDLNNLSAPERDYIERRLMLGWEMCRYDARHNTVTAVDALEIRPYLQSPGDYDYVLLLSRDYRPFMAVFYSSSEINW
jgi:hypothetical protein